MGLGSNPGSATSFWDIRQVAKPLGLSGATPVFWGIGTPPSRGLSEDLGG